MSSNVLMKQESSKNNNSWSHLKSFEDKYNSVQGAMNEVMFVYCRMVKIRATNKEICLTARCTTVTTPLQVSHLDKATYTHLHFCPLGWSEIIQTFPTIHRLSPPLDIRALMDSMSILNENVCTPWYFLHVNWTISELEWFYISAFPKHPPVQSPCIFCIST